MLLGVEQIHDVHGLGKMGLANRVVIARPVGQHHHRLGLLPTPPESLRVEAPAEERAGFKGPHLLLR